MRTAIRAIGCVMVMAALGACREDISIPRETSAELPNATYQALCDTGCSLLSTTEAWDLPVPSLDSADAWLPVASLVLGRRNGEAAVLGLLFESGLTGEALNLPLRITGPLEDLTITLGQLSSGLSLALVSGTREERLTLSVPRSSKFRTRQEFDLVLTSKVKIASVLAPWHRVRTSGPFFTPPPSSCVLVVQAATCGGIADAINPFVPGILGDFQSNSGTGASSPITITYSPSVNSVTIRIQDPTYAGNTMTAYNGTVPIGTISFPFSGVPGINVPVLRTLTGTISKIVLTPAPADYVAYEGGFESATVQVAVACTPTTLVRAATITCNTTLTPAQAYTVTRRTARGTGFTIEDSTKVNHLSGEVDAWAGPAIATSNVVVEVSVVTPAGDTAKVTNTTPATFTATKRTFPTWNLVFTGGFGSGQVTYTISPAEGLAAYPPSGKRWAVMQIVWPSFEDPLTYPTLSPTTGPNSTLRTLQNPFTVSEYDPYLSAGLDQAAATSVQAQYPSALAWYNDQNGLGSGTCVASNMLTFRDAVIRHEGGTGASNSHYGIANQQFISLKPDSLFEGVFGSKTDADFRADLLARLFKFSSDSTGPYQLAQTGFDNSDKVNVYPHLLTTGSCILDANPNDP